jgi:dihydrolipoamide dehydrogenase
MGKYDIGILGAGPGGYVAAIRGAQLGAKVCVVEKDEVGGTCLNWGCIPTKSLIASVRSLERARSGKEYGFGTDGSIRADFGRMIARKDQIVDRQVKGIQSLFEHYGITLRYGVGTLADRQTIDVAKSDGSLEQIQAERIIIATGSKPSDLPGLKIDGRIVISSNEALELKEVPKNMLIVGAGAIGCEFASIFQALGSEVSMVELLPRVVPMEDEEVSRTLERELKKRKTKLHVNTSVTSIEHGGDGWVCAHLSSGQALSAEKVLLSVGRAFNVQDIGLEEIGIEQGKRGEIVVDEKMETNVKGVYAIGDVIGGLMLAHVASREGIVAVENALGRERKMDYSAVPACIFSDPEIASAGLTEKEAVANGYRVHVGRFQMRGLGMAHALSEISGFVKLIADADTDRLLGAHMIGSHVTEMIHQAVLAIHSGVTVKEWAGMIHAHPTMSEALQEAVHDLRGTATHLPPKR